ncbi:MAG: VWA domain-containing protein [Myxococcales bacterium]|nr:VWA domain-containing protein [Myxococcales bacterium]MCB9713688.1 VWA domain-containing protein [Myxococcales bacterium]
MHASFASRLTLLLGASVALPSLFACLDHPLKPVEYEQAQEGVDAIALTVNKDVDILFVIDNSGSMGEEQATLAANFESFINVLEAPEVEANYRIGVTTTDNGNPWCQGTGPEAGQLRLTSCLSRPTEFVFEGAQTIDAFDEACAAVCPTEWTNIDVQPSVTTKDPEAKVRPWLENIEGATNLPEGLTTTQAFQCFGPQGINGCGFESHLESMWKALRRSQTETEASYGFIRDNAILSIVHVTDEADCSYNDSLETIFLPEGNRVFWSDPDAPAPSSAVCWNAGVACTGSGTYDECHSVNLDVDGNEVASDPDNNAVLRPLSRYTSFVQEFENNKQRITPDQEVLVAVIGGVNSDGTITYQDALTDPEFQSDFGVGPGCSSTAGEAVPPVRLAEFAREFQVGEQRNMFSICESDYSPALQAIAEAIADQVTPACMPTCVADTDPTSKQLDPSCVLVQKAPREDGTFEDTTIPACNEDGSLPADDDNVCFVALVDDGSAEKATDNPVDDMSDFCVDRGWNLEFTLVRREGFPAPGGTSVEATCQLSQNKAIDCPELP